MKTLVSWSERIGRVVSPSGGTDAKQLYFAAFVLGTTLIISISHVELLLTPPYLMALGVLATATALSVAVDWEAHRPMWLAVVPVLDMIAVALLRDLMRDSAVAVSLLVFIPALWLAARLRLRGVIIAVVAVSALIVTPILLRASHIDSLTITHALLLPFTVLQIGLLVVGGLAVMDGQHRRLTEALREKEALLEGAASSQRLLQNIIDSVDVGIVVVDEEGDDLLMNRAQRRIHALATPAHVDDPEESQLLLRHPGTATPIPAAQRPVRRAVLQESFDNYLVEVGPPGEGISFSSSARQILDGHGRRAGAVVVFSDVTSYLETVRSQERFVAAVSHELRTPLTSVIGYLELAREDETLDEQTSGFLDVAHRNADQLLLIVQDLLADQVSRAGTEELTLRPRRLSEIARRAVESAAPQAREAGIVLEADLEETPELPLDEKRVQQALGNLLSNALKYTPQGGRVHVRTSVRGNQLELSVVDTGIGMSMQEQAKLFTEYYRTRAARDSAIAGHGIGLALTRRIVVAHGGQISVRSRPGRGSTFTLRFALDGAETVESAAGRPSQAG